eukprot:COSAG05_NODE_1863_length_3942_cov_2.381473_7_plen_111_part_01
MQNLNIKGGTTGLLIRGAAGVRINNVFVEATALGDDVDTTAANCRKTGCNVVLGSMNGALLSLSLSLFLFGLSYFELANSQNVFSTTTAAARRTTIIVRLTIDCAARERER